MSAAESQPSARKRPPMTQKTSANVSVASAIMVIVAVLAFYTTAATRSQQISDDVSALAAIVADGSKHRRENRDILMEIKGQVAVLAAAHVSTERYVEELRGEVRDLTRFRCHIPKQVGCR